MTAPMRVGFLSTARINAPLAAGARAAEGVEVVAIGSRDRARAQAQAAELGIPRAHGSYEAVLEDPAVDAVYIPLPNSGHVEWSIRALEAGKHVLCEKPFSRTPADAERAFDVAEARGLVLMEAFMWRHHPQTQRLVELLPSLGELRLVRAQFSFPLTRAGDVRLSRALEGGALMDVGSYCVSGARLVAGEPESVAAHQVLGGDGVDVRLTATLRFAGDVLAHLDCGMDLPARKGLEVVGSEGSVVLTDPWHGATSRMEVHRLDGAVEEVEVGRADPYERQWLDLRAAVAGERAPLLGRADAVGQARTIAALYESAETGRSVVP